jgi:hypothetical protein
VVIKGTKNILHNLHLPAWLGDHERCRPSRPSTSPTGRPDPDPAYGRGGCRLIYIIYISRSKQLIQNINQLINDEHLCKHHCLIHYARVEYTSLELRQIGADSRFPAREVTVSVLSAITSHHPTLNFRTQISLLRPPRCIIVTHKVCTYAGLFIRRIMIGRANILSH